MLFAFAGQGVVLLLIVLCIVQGARWCLFVLISLMFSFCFSELCGIAFQVGIVACLIFVGFGFRLSCLLSCGTSWLCIGL